MDKKVDLNSNQTTNKTKLNIGKNKSILLTINYNHKPNDVFKPKVNKIGRKPSNLKYKKRTVQEDEQTELTANQPEGVEEIVVEETETDDEDDDAEEDSDEEELDDEEQSEDSELPDKDKIDKFKEKLKNRKKNKTQKQPGQKTKPPGNGGSNPPGAQANPSGMPGSGGAPVNPSAPPPTPPATPPVAPAATGGTVAAGGTAAAGETAAAAVTALAAPEVLGVVVIVLIILLIIVIIIAIILAIVGVKSDEHSGYYTYGTTCTDVTVVNTTNPADVGQVSLDNYIAGVVAAEVGNSNNIELYKTTAIVERTYILNNISSDCTVEGNSTFKEYVDIENHSRKDIIKQAIEETKGLVLIENEDLIDSSLEYGYIESQDNTYYYIGYGYNSVSGSNKQAIPKTWISEKSLTDEISSSSKNYDMSIVGAMYLIEKEGYSHEDVIAYYYGETVAITENTMILGGVNGFVNPTPTLKCTSPFSNRTDPFTGKVDFHGGIDIGVNEPIYAAKSGTISYVVKTVTAINAKTSNASNGYGYGNYIAIDHGDGTLTLYAHIKYGSIPDEIYKGATVEQGQQIGHTGSTGRSTGVHLHYEVRVNGERVDPADYLDLTNATGTCRR